MRSCVCLGRTGVLHIKLVPFRASIVTFHMRAESSGFKVHLEDIYASPAVVLVLGIYI
jgi:hypothetical protein